MKNLIRILIFVKYIDLLINPWSPAGTFMVQKMAITSYIPVF